MMTTKFTPGPWRVLAGKERALIMAENPSHGCVCECFKHVSGEEPTTQKANASLIAAAPELYETCQYLLDIFNHETRSVTALDSQKLGAVLAKARGEQQ